MDENDVPGIWMEESLARKVFAGVVGYAAQKVTMRTRKNAKRPLLFSDVVQVEQRMDGVRLTEERWKRVWNAAQMNMPPRTVFRVRKGDTSIGIVDFDLRAEHGAGNGDELWVPVEWEEASILGQQPTQIKGVAMALVHRVDERCFTRGNLVQCRAKSAQRRRIEQPGADDEAILDKAESFRCREDWRDGPTGITGLSVIDTENICRLIERNHIKVLLRSVQYVVRYHLYLLPLTVTS